MRWLKLLLQLASNFSNLTAFQIYPVLHVCSCMIRLMHISLKLFFTSGISSSIWNFCSEESDDEYTKKGEEVRKKGKE